MKDGRVDGHIAVNKTRFPDGIDGLAKKIHDMGLKLGIYSSESAPPPLNGLKADDRTSCGLRDVCRVSRQFGARGC